MTRLTATLAFLFASQTLGQDASEPEPFRIRVDEAVLVDLDERLARTRWPQQLDGSGWSHGPDVAWMRELVDYWRNGYDWRAEEKRLNAFPQYTVPIDGLNLHFLHVMSPNPDATPLVLVHGWPGSVYEFHKLIPMLTEPEKYGGRAEDAFHVVCPSLPGFALFPKEINVPPRAWVERSLGDRVIHWTEMARGGHFAAMEEPKRLVDDVRAFFAAVRKRGRE